MKRLIGSLLLLSLALVLISGLTVSARATNESFSVTITLDKTSVALDKGESITVTCEVKGGTEPYTYDYNKYAVLDGEEVIFSDTADEPSSITFRPRFGTEGYVTVSVEDANGELAFARSEGYTITDDPNVRPLRVTAVYDRATVDIATGESISATATVEGGEAPFTYDFGWLIYSGDTNDWDDGHTDESNKSTLTPTYGTGGQVLLEVLDAKGRQALLWMPEFTITGDTTIPGEPLALSIEADKSVVDVSKGERITITSTATGGREPFNYTYNWAISDGGAYEQMGGFGGTGLSVGEIKPTWGKKVRVEVTVTDDTDKRVTETLEFAITGDDAQPLTLSINLDKTVVDLSKGESITAVMSGGGGEAPYSYHYRWLIGDAYYYPSKYGERTDEATLTHAPTAAGEGQLWIIMFDAKERKRSEQVIFTIAEALIPGDADGDEKVEVADALRLIDYLVLGTKPPSMVNANADQAGEIDMKDLEWVIDQLAGK